MASCVMAGQAPHDIRALLRTEIRSVEEIAALLFLLRNQERTWQAVSVADAIQLPLADVRAALGRLQASKLVQSDAGHDPPTFRYAPSGQALATAVEGLFAMYEESPEEVMKMMSQHALERVRTEAFGFFSESFSSRRRDG